MYFHFQRIYIMLYVWLFAKQYTTKPIHCWGWNIIVFNTKYPKPISLAWILVAAWIINYIHYKGWSEVIYPFPNFNGGTVEVWEWISNFIQHSTPWTCDYLSMLGLKLIHVNKRGPYQYFPRDSYYNANWYAHDVTAVVNLKQYSWYLV